MKTVKPLVIITLTAFALACGDNAAPEQGANARPTATVRQAPAAPAATPDEFSAARADFSQFCIRCHKADGTGGPVELEDGKTLEVANLREHGLKDSDDHLAKYIREGSDAGMPAFRNRLDDQRINALVRFIRKEFHGRAAAAQPAASPGR
ncbi:MAG TPA: cytochrome c [Pyrinomonadaceae bacterium]|nr:cytochrome c [Pyrinomonadaceae bacterium]